MLMMMLVANVPAPCAFQYSCAKRELQFTYVLGDEKKKEQSNEMRVGISRIRYTLAYLKDCSGVLYGTLSLCSLEIRVKMRF